MLSTKVNGMRLQIKDTDMELKFGQTAQCIKDTGKMTKRMEMVDLFMRMGTSMKENGETTRLTVEEFTSTLMELNMMETGKKNFFKGRFDYT